MRLNPIQWQEKLTRHPKLLTLISYNRKKINYEVGLKPPLEILYQVTVFQSCLTKPIWQRNLIHRAEGKQEQCRERKTLTLGPNTMQQSA